jgi:hypothetical protein
MQIRLEWLNDEYECETCGYSFAEGASICFENGDKIELIPVASCFGSDSWTESQVFEKILEHLGHQIVS